MATISASEIKKLVSVNNLEKYREILSLKHDKHDSYIILDKTLKYDRPDIYNILFDAIINGNIFMSNNCIEVIFLYGSTMFIKKLINNDSFSMNLYSKILSYAIYYSDNTEIIELLFKKGVDPNYKNGKLFTLACNFRNEEKLKLLLDYGYEINYQNKKFIEGIINLIKQKNFKCLRLLCNYGVDLSFINNIEIKLYDHNKEHVDFLLNSGIELENIIKIFIGLRF
ncbi:repeat protein [Moumouvirus goulette]|uniref:Repeat protein n=1 Tax=Moumouvirus goulette TaxID=1247379 RepID=M1PM70_9VIRU|nr:repeat protein [Moumouvirus goulette]AGF85026.1 repeat protein [Moumouvirus goulette]